MRPRGLGHEHLEARETHGRALGDRRARKLPEADKARAVRDTVAAEHRALPAMIAVAVVHSDDEEIREEDRAAAMMAVQSLALAAVEPGLARTSRPAR